MSRHLPMVIAAARALNAQSAKACDIDADDSWKVYGDDYIADATEALHAAGAESMLAALIDAETVLRYAPDISTNALGTRPSTTTASALAKVRAAIRKATEAA